MKKITEIRKKIGQIKQKMMHIGDMRPGSLTIQPRSWGKTYWQLSYTHRGRGRTQYVSKERYEDVKLQTENYREFKDMSAELVDLSIELAKLTEKEAVLKN